MTVLVSILIIAIAIGAFLAYLKIQEQQKEIESLMHKVRWMRASAEVQGDVTAYWDVKLQKGEASTVKELQERLVKLGSMVSEVDDSRIIETIKIGKFKGEERFITLNKVISLWGLEHFNYQDKRYLVLKDLYNKIKLTTEEEQIIKAEEVK